MKIISDSVTRAVGRKVLKAKKNSPHIFFGLGLAGVGTGAVMACRATLKLQPVLDKAKEDIAAVKAMKEDAHKRNTDYAERGYPRDLGYVYGNTAVALTKLYGPSVLVGAAGVAALSGSHVQMTRRNAALTATLGALSRAYDEYRVKVGDELGKDRELEIFNDVSEVEETVDGKKIKTVTSDPTKYSIHARIFDESSTAFEKHAATNLMFLRAQQHYWTDVLRSRGHVFLNEVYKDLGFEHTPAGAITGWIYDADGHNEVNFGIYEPDKGNFVNGYEPRIILDFNVDGVIYERI